MLELRPGLPVAILIRAIRHSAKFVSWQGNTGDLDGCVISLWLERRLIQYLGSMPMRSLTADRMRCLEPRYRSVVRTETCPRRNWICSNSPPEAWHSFAHVRRRSCGASLVTPIRFAHCFTTCQTAFSVMLSPQMRPILFTLRKIRPCSIWAALSQTFQLHDDPVGDGNGSDMSTFAQQVCNRPVFFSLLKVIQPKTDSLMPPQTTRQEQC
jgi:hypothetical protein